MPNVFIRIYPSGVEVWRVVFRRTVPSFNLSFESRAQAIEWAYAHEKLYMQDPAFYFNWRKDLYYKMIVQGIDVSTQGILLPKRRPVHNLETPKDYTCRKRSPLNKADNA